MSSQVLECLTGRAHDPTLHLVLRRQRHLSLVVQSHCVEETLSASARFLRDGVSVPSRGYQLMMASGSIRKVSVTCVQRGTRGGVGRTSSTPPNRKWVHRGRDRGTNVQGAAVPPPVAAGSRREQAILSLLNSLRTHTPPRAGRKEGAQRKAQSGKENERNVT